MWGMNPLAGVRLTVINPGPTAPYTGMLPGLVAGHYSRDELDIDLVKLCRFAGARLILGAAHGLDRNDKTIQVSGRPDIAFDVVSLDIGVHTQMLTLDGFDEFGTAVKPIDGFASKWTGFLNDVETGACAPEAAVIGGGLGGAELALAINHRLSELGKEPDVSLIEAKGRLTGVSPFARALLTKELEKAGVRLCLNSNVTGIEQGRVLLGDKSQSSGFTVGSAGGVPHAWLGSIGLRLENGFISVDETLASVDDPDVFAAGDCAHLSKSPRPKAGVFAVRAAPVLYHNLKSRLSGTKPKAFRPQSTYLKLISLGGRKAIGEKGRFSLSGQAIWTWKNHIDQKFMDQFRALPKMAVTPVPQEKAVGVSEILNDKPLCGGCGAKVGAGALHDALCVLPESQRNDVLTTAGDDAAVLKIGGRKQVVSVDHLRAFDNDPWRMAKIATVHALGDIWAMGADPQSVLVSLILPRMSETLQRRTVREIMLGVQSISAPAGAEIVGGHTSMGAELTVGLTVTGLLSKGKDAITVAGALPGDRLVLTKPIGSGTLLAAEMAGDLSGHHLSSLLGNMETPQSSAAQILSEAHAMTDVTGFGLAGHLMAMCDKSGFGARLELAAIPVFDGAIEACNRGHHSSIYKDNALISDKFTGLTGDRAKLLFDPQTAGGLLAAVSPDSAEDVLKELLLAGYEAAIIGTVTDHAGKIDCV